MGVFPSFALAQCPIRRLEWVEEAWALGLDCSLEKPSGCSSEKGWEKSLALGYWSAWVAMFG